VRPLYFGVGDTWLGIVPLTKAGARPGHSGCSKLPVASGRGNPETETVQAHPNATLRSIDSVARLTQLNLVLPLETACRRGASLSPLAVATWLGVFCYRTAPVRVPYRRLFQLPTCPSLPRITSSLNVTRLAVCSHLATSNYALWTPRCITVRFNCSSHDAAAHVRTSAA
jgi:hypothetical protein